MIIFWKSVAGGLVAVVLMWFAILVVNGWREYSMAAKYAREHGGSLSAVAGGVGYLVGMPSTVLLVTTAFGAGFYLTTRWVYYSYIHSLPH